MDIAMQLQMQLQAAGFRTETINGRVAVPTHGGEYISIDYYADMARLAGHAAGYVVRYVEVRHGRDYPALPGYPDYHAGLTAADVPAHVADLAD